MGNQPVIHNTFVLEKQYAKPPETVFSALADPAKRRRWFAEGDGHDVEEFSFAFKKGGTERLRGRFKAGTPLAGAILKAEGSFLDIVPNVRVVNASTMSVGSRCISAALVTIELRPEGSGTVLKCTHQAAFFEGADGPEMREAGWRALLDRLAGEAMA